MSLRTSLPKAIVAAAVMLCSVVSAPAQESGVAPDSTAATSDIDRVRIGLEELSRLRVSIETMLTRTRSLSGEEFELQTVAVLAEVSDLEEIADELVVDDPITEVFVSRLDDAWVEISVWPWTHAVHWWTMKTNLSRILRLALDEKGIEHAFPRYEIQMPDARDPGDPPSTPA